MINIKITEKAFWKNDCEGYAFIIKEGLKPLGEQNSFDQIQKEFWSKEVCPKEFCPNLKDVLKTNKFDGKKGQSYVLTTTKNKKLTQLVFVGIGKLEDQWNYELENLRRAIGLIVKQLKKLEIKKSVLFIPNEKSFGLTLPRTIRQVAIAATLASYEFKTFKTEKKKEWKGELLIALDSKSKTVEQDLNEGVIIGQATNTTRHFADMPANHLTPISLAKDAKKIAEKYKLTYSVFGEKKAKELGMGGFLSVDVGSDQPGQFVILEYKVKDKKAPTIALVGKGVTFDTGGVSLKPAQYMTGMKFDMCGAAAVIGTMQAIAQLKPNVNVISLTPLVENMPSGKATKQDDIVTFMNGKTAEIQNTDAEGRLILADALCYAEKFYKPDVILDIATLTGACLYALGPFFAGLMTKDEVIGTKLQAISLVSGDRVWPLPLDDDFKDAIKSEVADISNTGASAYKAGTITAGWFLKNFVDKSKWAHIDIAGTADNVPGISYFGKGATGAGVRLFTEFVLNYNK